MTYQIETNRAAFIDHECAIWAIRLRDADALDTSEGAAYAAQEIHDDIGGDMDEIINALIDNIGQMMNSYGN